MAVTDTWYAPTGTGIDKATGDLIDETFFDQIGSDVLYVYNRRWQTGDLKQTLRNTADAGWVLAYGQTVNANAGQVYNDLWVYANANGLVGAGKPFNGTIGSMVLPDMRGMALVGLDTMGGSARNLIAALNALGATTGEAAHVLTTAEMAQHNHPISESAHAHQTDQATGGTGSYGQFFGNNNAGHGYGTLDSRTTGLTTLNAGSNTAHNTVQPSYGVNTQIKL